MKTDTLSRKACSMIARAQVHRTALYLAGLTLLLCALAGCVAAPQPTPVPATQAPAPTAAAQAGGAAAMANPASVYCKEQGYTVEIRADASGNQKGICIFSAGDECDEWAFFRHECGPGATASSAVTSTQVIHFVPAPANGEPRTGSCFASSLAAWREDAWRCTVDSDIYDPCFADGDVLICDADPTTHAAGFPLKLSQPLPTAEVPQATAGHAWLLELADGTVCGYATGATGGVGDKRINYLCRGAEPSRRPAILGELQPGAVWTAQVGAVVASDQGPTIKETTTVPVRRVWQ